MLALDNNNILSVGELHTSGKEYTRSFFWYPITAYDHTVLLHTKKWFEQKQWKDVWAGQSVIQIKRTDISVISGEAKMPLNKWFSRLWFDLLYKYDETKGETINIAKQDEEVLEYANAAFGTSRSALVMPAYESCLAAEALPSFFFGIAVAHGKWPIKNEVLSPVKITIPLTSSLLWKKEFFEQLTVALRSQQILHSAQFLYSGTYDVVQITLHDPILLQTYATRLNPIVKIAKISTFERTQKVYDQLVTYATEQWLSLPIASANEVLVLESD